MITQTTHRPTSEELVPGDVITHPRERGNFIVVSMTPDTIQFEGRQPDGTFKGETSLRIVTTNAETGEEQHFIAALSYEWDRGTVTPDFERASSNRAAVESMLDYLPLPAPTVIVRADAVYITVSDLDDLGTWLQARGGYIHVSSASDGLELWTLLTTTTRRPDGTSVRVRVSVPVPVGETVLGYIRAAVTA